MKTKAGEMVPLLKAIYHKYIREDELTDPPPKTKPKDKNDKDFRTAHLLQVNIINLSRQYNSIVPGCFFFVRRLLRVLFKVRNIGLRPYFNESQSRLIAILVVITV